MGCQTNITYFHLLGSVGRGGETQLQVGKNLNYSIQCFKGYYTTSKTEAFGYIDHRPNQANMIH